MLTKNDLEAIRDIVDERLDTRLEEKLDKKLKPISKNIRGLRKDVDYMIKKFDENDVKLYRRVKKIEDHLRLSI